MADLSLVDELGQAPSFCAICGHRWHGGNCSKVVGPGQFCACGPSPRFARASLTERGEEPEGPNLTEGWTWEQCERDLRDFLPDCPDRRLARRIRFILDHGNPSTERGERLSEDAVSEMLVAPLADALNDAWGDWVGDTGCFPDCITVEKGRDVLLSADFTHSNFVRHVASRLAPHLIDRHPPPTPGDDEEKPTDGQ